MMSRAHIREAAESLLSSVNPQNRTPSHTQSINLVSEDLVAGHRPDGRMSTVRRFFCLFVTFDLLFTGLMWLICVMMGGETLEQIFNREIINYSIKKSQFDVVVMAVIRFSLLLLFYAVLYINNWSVIALSTGGTCAFLIAKVFVFDWPDASQPVYQVFLILTSFTLAWSEAWFLDFRVLPQELQAKSLLEAIVHHGASERTPLLNPTRPAGVRSTFGESTVNWFSPVESPESSPKPSRQQEVILTQEQIDEYKSQAYASATDALEIINRLDWKVEKKGVTKGDVVESCYTEKFGKVYRFTGMVECPPEFIYNEFKNNMSRLPEWNPTMLKYELIKDINPNNPRIDLSYQVTAGGGRGIIAPRDFVTLRFTAGVSRDGTVVDDADPASPPPAFISGGISVQVPGYPPNNNFVRGHNKVGCWYMTRKVHNRGGDKVEDTVFQWLMSCDLKGKIPQFVLDTAFSTAMLDYIVHVRKFVADSKANGSLDSKLRPSA